MPRAGRNNTNGYAHAGRKARTSAPTKDAVKQESSGNQAKQKKPQVPDAPQVHATSRERTYTRNSTQAQQLNQQQGELPELKRQVEKENGESRSRKGDTVCSGRTLEVGISRMKRDSGRSASATSVGRTTSGAMAK